MAYVDLEYKGNSFEENPHLITWVQLFVIKRLRPFAQQEDWIQKWSEELELNSKIDIYKYLFDDNILNSPEKETWAITFFESALTDLNTMTLSDFGDYIWEEINETVDYDRIKNVVRRLLLMLKGEYE